MRAYLQLAGFRSDGVSSDCISKIGDTEVVEVMTAEEVIAKVNESLAAARENRVWRPVILLALEGRRWAPDTCPGWWMDGRWLFSFDPERDVEQLTMVISEIVVVETAKFACSKEGRRRGSGAMRRLKDAVAAVENFSTTYAEAIDWLGEPDEETFFTRPSGDHVQTVWSCGCAFHETENGSGILFTCEKHSR